MDYSVENILLGIAILLFLSILVSKGFGRLGIPALVLFLGVGMLAGSDGLGGIYFDDAATAQSLGTVCLMLILFSGGLDTNWTTARPVLWRSLSLSTAGVLITAVLVGYFAHWILGFSLLEGILLGAIVSSTDAAAVFSILRMGNVGLKNRLRPTLELESGSNDPMAYFLTVSFTFLLTNPEGSIWQLVPMFLLQMSLGAAVGLGMGYTMAVIINRIKLSQEGLYPALTIAMVLFSYAFTSLVGGNGFLAVYIAAVILGNRNFIHKRSLTRFYDGVAWLAQILLFLTLGLLVFPSQTIPVLGAGLLVSLFLIFVARPVSVFICLYFFKTELRDKIFVSWVGLRGAVPIVFATFPLLAGIEKSGMIFNIVFFIVLTSALLQGTTLQLVARWLGLSENDDAPKRIQLGEDLGYNTQNELVELKLPKGSAAIGRPLVDLQLPKSSLIVLIDRGGKFVTPTGSTMLEANDKLMVMVEKEDEIAAVRKVLL